MFPEFCLQGVDVDLEYVTNDGLERLRSAFIVKPQELFRAMVPNQEIDECPSKGIGRSEITVVPGRPEGFTQIVFLIRRT
jgi:hypothetical protein